jgi:hypothetical protein
MGRVALAIEAHVLPGAQARWLWVPRRKLTATSFAAWAAMLEQAHPARLTMAGDGLRISEGIICTNDPECAREVLTLLAVERAAIQAVTESGPGMAPS